MDVVSGGCGFLGSHLAEALLAQGRKVAIIDIQPWKYKPHPNLEVVIGDIRDAFEFKNVDRIFHLAALADIIPSIEKPEEYYETNVTGTFNMLQAARNAGCQKFIYAASASCYGIESDLVGGTAEYDDCNPQYPYALTKYMGEQLVIHWMKVYKIPAISLRLFNVYGLRHRTNGAYGAMFGTFLAQLANQKPVTIVGDGSQKRDFVHVSDVVNAMIIAADSKETGIYNVGTGNPSSVMDIVKMLGAKDIAFLPERPGEPNITCAYIDKIKRQLDWKPKMSIQDGVKELLDNIESYRDAKVWEFDTIAKATKSWFEALA
jgi:UDP-glucose 4-epimerase